MKVANHVAEWLDDATAWWLRELGPVGETFVLPIDAHFPTSTPQGLFDSVLGFADMRDWKFELVDESDTLLDDPMANMPRPAAPRPMLSAEDPDEELPEGGPYPIAYTSELAADPTALVASFACDVSHYLLYAASDEPPGGDEHRQAFVEVGAVMMGFGVFVANSCLHFQQMESGGLHGWSTAARGVLGEDALGYLLGLFVSLREVDPKLALGKLKANPAAAFKWSHAQLQGPRRGSVEKLRAIVPPTKDGGPYR